MDSSCEDEGSQSEKKRPRLVFETCIICSATAPNTDLTSPRDEHSWKTLLRAAEIQDFVPITNYANDESVPRVYYHTACRNTFTLKKTLDNILAKGGDATSGCAEQRQSMRNPIPSTSRFMIRFVCSVKSVNMLETHTLANIWYSVWNPEQMRESDRQRFRN